MNEKNSLTIFQGSKIRKTWFKEEWWFSIIDIVAVLTGSTVPKRYWADLKSKLIDEGNEPYDNIVRLKLIAEDEKMRETDCTNTEGAFRIIQSIPSPKAEPFKLWLAKVGYERIQEIENPELAQDRAKGYYEMKGYPKEWIDKRLRGIAIRQELTSEWKERGVKQNTDFAILTNEISKATFDKTINEYKQFKGLKKPNQNLRDHMDDLELIFTMLGEKATTKITQTRNDKEFLELKSSAKRGGQIAANARKELEKETKTQVSTKKKYLHLTNKKNILNIQKNN
jgi:DNA-damage-inducible protein D